MSVVAVTEIWDGRQGSQDDKGARGYTRTFRVITNDRNDGSPTVLTAIDPVSGLAIPSVFDPYQTLNEVDLGSYVKALRPSQQQNPYVWVVHVEYSSVVLDPKYGDPDPLLRPTDIDWAMEQYKKPIEEDLGDSTQTPAIAARALQNSAGEFFDPPPDVQDNHPRLVMVKNEAVFDYAQAVHYRNAVNSDAWYGQPVNTVKVHSIKSKYNHEGIYPYWQTTYEFKIRDDGWDLRMLDQGFCTSDNNGKPQQILDENTGQPVTRPRLLNGGGALLDTGDAPTFLIFYPYPKLPFSVLGLP